MQQCARLLVDVLLLDLPDIENELKLDVVCQLNQSQYSIKAYLSPLDKIAFHDHLTQVSYPTQEQNLMTLVLLPLRPVYMLCDLVLLQLS